MGDVHHAEVGEPIHVEVLVVVRLVAVDQGNHHYVFRGQDEVVADEFV